MFYARRSISLDQVMKHFGDLKTSNVRVLCFHGTLARDWPKVALKVTQKVYFKPPAILFTVQTKPPPMYLKSGQLMDNKTQSLDLCDCELSRYNFFLATRHFLSSYHQQPRHQHPVVMSQPL